MKIRDRVALVTGGAHRLGREIALRLASEGAHVALTYHAAVEAAAATLADLASLGSRSMALPCDQSDPAQVAGAMQTLQDRFGRLDILVNSAAIMQQKSFLDITPEDLDATLDINLKGPFLFTQAAARIMLAQENPGGVIIHIADEAGLTPWPRYVHHSVSKAGVVMLTRAAALALAPGVRVNAIAPGPVLKPAGWPDERWDALRPSTPLVRLGTPSDVTEAVVYLIQADFVTGHVLVVDGGRTLV